MKWNSTDFFNRMRHMKSRDKTREKHGNVIRGLDGTLREYEFDNPELQNEQTPKFLTVEQAGHILGINLRLFENLARQI